VMYAGRIVEIGPVRAIVQQPNHPYTAGLMASIPRTTGERCRLQQIDGTMPRLNAIPPGCPFHPRCPEVRERCRRQRPDLLRANDTRAACWFCARVAEPADA
jgi:peptide/nickel transport system ATP-binding protein